MSARPTHLVLSVLQGAASEPRRTLAWGRAVPAFSVGRRGDWALTAPEVADLHLELAFDGSHLRVRATSEHHPVSAGGARLEPSWTELPLPVELRFGAARLGAHAVLRAAQPLAHTTQVEPERLASLIRAARSSPPPPRPASHDTALANAPSATARTAHVSIPSAAEAPARTAPDTSAPDPSPRSLPDAAAPGAARAIAACPSIALPLAQTVCDGGALRRHAERLMNEGAGTAQACRAAYLEQARRRRSACEAASPAAMRAAITARSGARLARHAGAWRELRAWLARRRAELALRGPGFMRTRSANERRARSSPRSSRLLSRLGSFRLRLPAFRLPVSWLSASGVRSRRPSASPLSALRLPAALARLHWPIVLVSMLSAPAARRGWRAALAFGVAVGLASRLMASMADSRASADDAAAQSLARGDAPPATPAPLAARVTHGTADEERSKPVAPVPDAHAPLQASRPVRTTPAAQLDLAPASSAPTGQTPAVGPSTPEAPSAEPSLAREPSTPAEPSSPAAPATPAPIAAPPPELQRDAFRAALGGDERAAATLYEQLASARDARVFQLAARLAARSRVRKP